MQWFVLVFAISVAYTMPDEWRDLPLRLDRYKVGHVAALNGNIEGRSRLPCLQVGSRVWHG
jgi:hypothetical protein